MKQLISFKRDEQASNVTKIILVVWLAFLGLNRDTLFNRVELVPVEIEQTAEQSQSVDAVDDTSDKIADSNI